MAMTMATFMELGSMTIQDGVWKSVCIIATVTQLLAQFKGISDHPNLSIFGTTNRRNDMDEAFLRRLDEHHYVGLMDPTSRFIFFKTKFLEVVPPRLRPSSNRLARTNPNTLDQIQTVLKSLVQQHLLPATTNFSGAFLKMLSNGLSEGRGWWERIDTHFRTSNY